MNIGSNVGVDTSSSAFISAASKQDPLSYDQWVNEAENTFSGMFHSTTILECAVYITAFYLSFTFLERHYFGRPKFMQKWKISRATALDIACKTISGGFALMATFCGILILWNAPVYTPIPKERSSFLLDRVMIWASSYFVYDFFAMYHVYLARKEEKTELNSTKRETSLSQTMRLQTTKDNNELINTTLKSNRNDDDSVPDANSSSSNLICDNNRKSISGEIIGDVSMNAVSNARPSLRTYIEDNPLIVAHHMIIGVFLIPMMSVYYPKHEPGDMMIASALIFEASTPFVSLRSVLSYLDGMRHSRLYMINGIAMVLAFFSCRILIYPIFFKMYGIQRNISMIQGIFRTPWHCSIWMIGLLLPQLYWFRIMFIGAMKVVLEKKKVA